ncbi:MAG: hypothetical protein ACM3MF_10600 [Anaerolineae bacterium]
MPGTPEAYYTVCDRAHEGLDLSTEGYLRLPDTLTGTDSVILRLYHDASYSGKPLGVSVRFGEQPNEAIRINSAFNDEDLRVHLANGKVIPFGTKVRVSGRVYFPVLAQDFDCALDRPYIEEAK